MIDLPTTAALWLLFGLVTFLVVAGLTSGIDLAVTRAVQAHPSAWLDDAGSLFGVLGSAEVTGPAALVLGVVVWQRSRRLAVAIVAAFGIAVVVEVVLKDLIAHPGPTPVYWRPFWRSMFSDQVQLTGSYPSGHAMRTAFLAFTGAALFRSRPAAWAAVVVIAAMAVSRVYMGSHWTADVVGGVVLGVAMGCAALLAGTADQPRGILAQRRPLSGDHGMAQNIVSERPKAPDFEEWESPETHVRWARGLALIAGMIAIVITFIFLWSVIPLSSEKDSEAITGLQPTAAAPAVVEATAAAAAAATALPSPPPQDQRLTAVSRAFPNVRQGPSLSAAVVSNLRQGQTVEVVGRSQDNLWLQILNPTNSRERLWVSADMLDVTGDARTLPVQS